MGDIYMVNRCSYVWNGTDELGYDIWPGVCLLNVLRCGVVEKI